jgi:NTP pyrophosphatase (non-canonical NTP hydrolase)
MTTMGRPVDRVMFVNRILAELDRAYAKHGSEPWSRHQFYAVLLEEVDELWDAIKQDATEERITEEMVQVAAMCFRHAETRHATRAATGGVNEQ